MPAGLIVWRPGGGQLEVSTDSRLTNFRQYASTGTQNGSISVPVGPGQTVFFAVFQRAQAGAGRSIPSFSVSGGTVSWTFDSTGLRIAADFVVGVAS